MFGHRWQILRASILILNHLENRMAGLSLPVSVEGAYLEILAEAKNRIEEWKPSTASAKIKAFMEKVRSDRAGGVIGKAEAELLAEYSERLLELMEI